MDLVKPLSVPSPRFNPLGSDVFLKLGSEVSDGLCLRVVHQYFLSVRSFPRGVNGSSLGPSSVGSPRP